jgi:hypothetical protein
VYLCNCVFPPTSIVDADVHSPHASAPPTILPQKRSLDCAHTRTLHAHMDFLKSCTTGVQTLPGFGSVQYHVYAVEKKDESRADKEEVALEDILASLGSQLRARRYLTFIDPARRALWIFRGGSDTGFADGPLDEGFAEPVRGISLKCE